jgi:hypothetical protein
LASWFEHIPFPTEYWIPLVGFGPVLYILEKLRKSVVRRGFFGRKAPGAPDGVARDAA